MNRRDTIIVAVLINAGLLVVLFVSALKTPSSTEVVQVEKAAPLPPLEKKKPLVPVKGDEVDKALADYKEAHKVEKKASEKKVLAKQPQKVDVPIAKKAPEPVKKEEVKESPKQEVAFIIVQKGDMLEKIARKNGTTVTELMRVNKLKSANLQIGQKLILPEKRANVNSTPSSEQYYVVKNGDNLWKIAIENHLKVEQLLKLNNLDEKKAKKLRPGDKLRIR